MRSTQRIRCSGLAAELGATLGGPPGLRHDSELMIARAGVVATLLPGCSFTLRGPYPSARRLVDRGLHVALALISIPHLLCENMQNDLALAMSSMGMSLEEALTAATIMALAHWRYRSRLAA